MTAVLQTHARKNGIPIDTLAFRTNILPITVEEV
jgi:hypothetical protein